jgi:hypothetical protein
MLDRKFVTLFRTLDKGELSGFEAHLKGNYGRQKIALAVFDYLKKLYPEFSDARKLDIGYAHRKIFKYPEEKKSDRKRLLNALSDLNLWLRDYLLQEEIKKDVPERDFLWLKILSRKKLDDAFFRQAERTRKALEVEPGKNMWSYFYLAAVHYLEFFHPNYRKLEPDVGVLKQFNYFIDLFYVSAKLQYACEAANRRKILQDPGEPDLPDLVNELMKKDSIRNEKTVEAYRLLYLMNSNPEKAATYLEVKDFLLDDHQSIHIKDQEVILSYLLNFTASQVRRGNSEFFQEAFELYRFGLKEGILTQDGYLSPTKFNNIVNIACLLKEFDWVEAFIRDYEEFLDKKSRESEINLARGIIRFEREEFSQAVEVLSKVVFSDVFDPLRAKSFLLRSYYELDENENLILDFCHSFEKSLRRNKKLGRETILTTLNFIKTVRKLTQKKEDKAVLIAGIKSAEYLFFKDWLLEKAAGYDSKFAARKGKGASGKRRKH